jgi:hypothetical protein
VKALAGIVLVLATLALGAGSASAARECEGFMVCVPIAGPWVVVPTATTVPRPVADYQLTCPRGYIVGGVDATLSQRGIDVSFSGRLGSPVNPGVTTRRSVVFSGTYVGSSPRSPTFKPHAGCIPATGGGSRVPTSVTAVRPGEPPTRHVRTARVRPGTSTVVARCSTSERLVGATFAFGFFTRRPPSASLVEGVSGRQSVSGHRVSVRVQGDAELGGVRAVVQVQAVCARTA